MPPRAEGIRFGEPKLVARRPGRTAAARSPKYTRAASAVARQEFAKDKGSCGSTSTVKAVPIAAQSSEGATIAEGPRAASPAPRQIITTAPAPTSASETG